MPTTDNLCEPPSRYRIAYDGRCYMIQVFRRFWPSKPQWVPYLASFLDGMMELAYQEVRSESKADLEPILERLQAAEHTRWLYSLASRDFKRG